MDKTRILERYYAQVAEGVQRFPRPVVAATKEAPVLASQAGGGAQITPPTPSPVSHVDPPTAAAVQPFEPVSVPAPNVLHAHPGRSAAQVAACTSCRLCEGRSKVLVQAEWRPARVFVVAESVSPEDDAHAATVATVVPFSAEKSPSRILARLLERLEQGSVAHRAYATKCLARRGYGHAELRTCARLNLGSELAHVRPAVVLAFGPRARDALVEVFGSALGGALPSSGEGGGLDDLSTASPWGTVRVVSLPSALELDAYPEWRKGVWERLAFLRPSFLQQT